MVECNLTPEEQEAALALFPMHPSMEELERSKRYFQRYIFYDTWGRKNFREYFCPECGRFEIEKPWRGFDIYQQDPFSDHHNDAAQCPRCGAAGILICLGRAGKMKSLRQWEKIAFIRNAGGVLTVTAGEARRVFDWEDLDPLPEFFARARYVVEPGKRQMWRNRTWWDGAQSRCTWEAAKSFTEPFPRTSYMMGGGLRRGEVGFVGVENIAGTSMRYCAAEQAFEEGYDCRIDDRFDGEPVRGVIRYLGEYSVHPQLEMLVKLGHLDVIRALLEKGSVGRGLVNWRAKDPAGFFRLSKSEYAALRGSKGNVLTALKKYREYRPEGMSLAEFLDIWGAMGGAADEFFTACRRYNAPLSRAAAWLRGQKMETGPAVGMWKDYLSMAARLERDMTFRRNLFPEDLRREHDGALALEERRRAMDSAKRQEAYRKKRFRRLRKMYEYTDGDLSVAVPQSEEEIIREGEALEHCVGGYARRHMEGKTTILFLRRAEDLNTPYVTIEINDATGQLVQVHGYRNEGDGAKKPIARHKEFFDEWLEWLRRGSPRTPNGKPIRPEKKEMEVKSA